MNARMEVGVGVGGDRATGYAMSNKILRLPEGLLVTWLDPACRNRWALCDPDTGAIRRSGFLGPEREDNHCGAALARTGDVAHAVLGAHHGTLSHYVMRPSREMEWRHVAELPGRATYPCLLADGPDRLLLTHRTEGPHFTLDLREFDGNTWSGPRPLAVADKPGYVYWTNGLTAAPDGTVHLVFGNTRLDENGDLYFGASHLYSSDQGRSWYSDGRGHVPDGVSVRDLPLIVPESDSARSLSVLEQDRTREAGPSHMHYLQLLLSNPVVDSRGRVYVTVHNGREGTADLWIRGGEGRWRSIPLRPLLDGPAEGHRIHLQSSLGLDSRNRIHAGLMIHPGAHPRWDWGPNGTFLVRLVLSPEGKLLTREVVPPVSEGCVWLPALEHPLGSLFPEVPALLYTRGANAGGFEHNQNRLESQVFLML